MKLANIKNHKFYKNAENKIFFKQSGRIITFSYEERGTNEKEKLLGSNYMYDEGVTGLACINKNLEQQVEEVSSGTFYNGDLVVSGKLAVGTKYDIQKDDAIFKAVAINYNI